MGSERILCDRPPAEVVAERNRVLDMLTVVVDDVITQVGSMRHPVANQLLGGFAKELATLRKFVREGGPVEAFVAAREPKEDGRGK